MSSEDLSGLVYSNHGSQKLVAVQDITCDIAGNLEFVNQHTTIDKPYFEGTGGILMSSIDILPTELRESASVIERKLTLHSQRRLRTLLELHIAIR
jgi:hypothetical protein